MSFNVPPEVREIAKSLPEEKLHAIVLDATAESAFNAYNETGSTPWKTFDGRDVPRWDAITEQVREKWRASVLRVIDHVELEANTGDISPDLAEGICSRIMSAVP